MKTDEILVLLLIALRVAAVAAVSVHSRRQKSVSEAADRKEESGASVSPDPRAIFAQEREPVRSRKRNRRR